MAYRYFTTGTRKYIIADAPGHEQYTRNMVTAASTANLAIILVDARKGVLTQTRRHSYLAHLVGIPHIVVAINKMDLVDYDQADVRGDQGRLPRVCRTRLGIDDVRFIPMSALNGDMVVDRGDRLDWYEGPTLLDILEAAPAAHTEKPEKLPLSGAIRLPPAGFGQPELHDYRGFMGRVESGEIAVGDAVTVLPSGNAASRTLKSCGQSLPRRFPNNRSRCCSKTKSTSRVAT